MYQIFQGVENFQSKVFPYLEPKFRELAVAQQPHTLFITCCDSRVVPNMITLTSPGELFVCRSIGNIVPPHGSEDKSVGAAVEYAVGALNVKNIVVCGHSDCGAMKGLLNPEKLEKFPTTAAWLRHAEAARNTTLSNARTSSRDLLNSLVEQNVIQQVENLKTHPSVASTPDLLLCGLVYDIGSGSVKTVVSTNKTAEGVAA